MDYKIDTITVIDAFKEDCECPLCKIKADMDAAYVSSCLGAGAMVPERRVEVNRCGFCTAHLKQLYDAQTRLPLALQLQTHLHEQNAKNAKLLDAYAKKAANSGGLFGGKKKELNEELELLKAALTSSEETCVICSHTKENLRRYEETVLTLYQKDSEFKRLVENGKGFCVPHFLELLMLCAEKKSPLTAVLIQRQKAAMQRLDEELLWFTKKFDYANKDADWGNSRDSIPRTINKLKGQTV